MKKKRLIICLILFVNTFCGQAVCAEPQVKTNHHYLLSNFEGQGLFVTLNSVIGLLDLYEKSQSTMSVSVDFGNEGLYFSKEKGPNWWSYYFEPIALGNIRKAKIKRISQDEMSGFCWKGGRVISRSRARKLMNKYIKIKPEIHQIVNEFVHSYFDSYFVVGIHYRGTDKFIEAAPYVSYEKVASQLDSILKECNQPTKIFVATDEQRFLDFMKIRYESKLIYQNIYRSVGNEPLHFTHHDKYKNGLDAVVDCLLLSRCHVLLKTASNLSAFSQMFNPSLYVVNLSLEY